MLKVGIVDANQSRIDAEKFIDNVVSVVGHWLKYEMDKTGLALSPPNEADVIFLVYAGAIDFISATRRALRRLNIETDAAKRVAGPYIITGGPVDVAPYTALAIADALAIGEAYLYVRQVLDIIKADGSVQDVNDFSAGYDHALTRDQLPSDEREPDRPWLFAKAPPILARPDEYVDWEGTPSIRSPDKVTRLLVSKGCHMKCKFCATTYRQTYRVNEHAESVLTTIKTLRTHGERVSFITNDVADLPYFNLIPQYGSVDNQSLTIKAIRDEDRLQTLVESGIKIARFGVEGISERIRHGFGKPIPNEELYQRIAYLNGNGVNTHMFFIVGAPYETAEDWAEFRKFYGSIAKVIRRGLCRIKLTAFTPCATTPLGYFVSPSIYYQHMKYTQKWVAQNWANHHMFIIPGKKPESLAESLREQFAVTKSQAAMMVKEQTHNLAPTLDDARRFQWEVVQWPLDVTKRWKLGQSYMKYMGAQAWASEKLS